MFYDFTRTTVNNVTVPFGLLASTGLRISEALRLRFDDMTPDGLVICETKFKESRLVPLHGTVVEALDSYLERRRRCASADPHIFVSALLHKEDFEQSAPMLATF